MNRKLMSWRSPTDSHGVVLRMIAFSAEDMTMEAPPAPPVPLLRTCDTEATLPPSFTDGDTLYSEGDDDMIETWAFLAEGFEIPVGRTLAAPAWKKLLYRLSAPVPASVEIGSILYSYSTTPTG